MVINKYRVLNCSDMTICGIKPMESKIINGCLSSKIVKCNTLGLLSVIPIHHADEDIDDDDDDMLKAKPANKTAAENNKATNEKKKIVSSSETKVKSENNIKKEEVEL